MRKNGQALLIGAIVLLVVIAVALFARYQKTSSELAMTKQSEQKTESKYQETIDAIAEIQDSLNAIALGDAGVGVHRWGRMPGQEPSQTKGQEALDRIAVMRESISRNKARIQELESNIHKSGVRLASLQRMVNNLKHEVREKEDMVAQLTEQVGTLQTQVTGLTTQVAETQDTLHVRDQQLEDKRRELATVYYIVGPKSVLKDAGVVQSKGGLLGIGKTLQPSPMANVTAFSSMDTDQETVIRTSSSKAKVISAQPATSYQMMLVDGRMELHITDPTEFRKVKQVVILTS